MKPNREERALPGDKAKKTLKHKLPVKDSKGKWKRVVEVVENSDNEDEQLDAQAAAIAAKKHKSDVFENFLLGKQSRKILALKCTKVIEFPEANIGHLRDIQTCLTEGGSNIPSKITCLALGSLMEVYKDIIPGYRIRKVDEIEEASNSGKKGNKKMKKENEKLAEFEESLMSNYGDYLKLIETTMKDNKSENEKLVAVKSIGSLLTTHPHFNFRQNIIQELVNYSVQNKGTVEASCCESLRTLFLQDRLGDVSLVAVTAIAKLVGSSPHKAPRHIIDILTSVKIDSDHKRVLANEKEKRKEHLAKLSRNERKEKKKMALVEKDLRATKAEEDARLKALIHSKLVTQLFATYFRILKSNNMGVKRKLLAPVLKGVAQFGQMINIEFFDDMFNCLDSLLNEQELSVKQRLYCVLAVFRLQSTMVLNVEPQKFYSHLQAALDSLTKQVSLVDVEVIKLILHCGRSAFIKHRKSVAYLHVLEFATQAMAFAAKVRSKPDNGGAFALSVLLLLKELIVAFPRLANCFANGDSSVEGLSLEDEDDQDAYAPHVTVGMFSSGTGTTKGVVERERVKCAIGEFKKSSDARTRAVARYLAESANADPGSQNRNRTIRMVTIDPFDVLKEICL